MCIHIDKGERRGREERERGEGGGEKGRGEERKGGRMDSHIQSWLKNHAPPHVCIGLRFWLLR